MNPFEFYGLVPSLHIDEGDLRRQYLKVQREWHPDYFAADPEKQLEAAERTSLNNRFYQKLNSLSARMQTILEMHNMAGDAGNILPGSFLMEMMELNDEIEAAYNNPQILSTLQNQVQLQEQQVLNEAAELANSRGENIVQPQFLKLLQVMYQKLCYLRRVANNLQKQINTPVI